MAPPTENRHRYIRQHAARNKLRSSGAVKTRSLWFDRLGSRAQSRDTNRAVKTTFLFLLLLSPFVAALAQPPPQKPELARVAILKYQDLTGTKNFRYLPASLTEAIDASLQKKFEYVREDPATTDAAYRALQ